MTSHEPFRSSWIIITIIAVVVVAMSASVLSRLWSAYDRQGLVREVVIPEGIGATGVARVLEREGIVRHRSVFSVYSVLTGKADDLQAGTYLLCPCQSVPSLVGAIAGGDAMSNDIRLTIPEGTNIWGLDALLMRLDIISRYGAFSETYFEQEGMLFPETYFFSKNVTLARVAARLTEEFEGRAEEYTTEEVVIASMLEKEAKTSEDMALVAGIIYERMRRGIALQVDATVAYGWCVRTIGFAFFCDVTEAPIATEIKVDGPYNTYTRTDLPVGPISNPGSQALYAAAHPQESEYLYYLSTRDGSEIIYAQTLDEHLQNRVKYLGF